MRIFVGMGLIALSLSTQAATSPSVIQAQSAITGLAFQVTDLNPLDGIAPTFVPFNNAVHTTVSARWVTTPGIDGPNTRDSSTNEGFTGTFFNSPAVTASLFSGQADASKSGNGLSSNLDVKASSFEGARYIPFRGTWFGTSSFNSSATVDPTAWLLAPGTEVTITGTIHTSLAVNTDGIVGLTDGQVLDVSGRSSSYVYLEIPGLGFTTPSQWKREYDDLTVHQFVSPTGSWSNASANALLDKTFSLTARNTGTSTMTIGLSAGTQTQAYWDVATIPESSTWVFGLAGLGAMGVCLRRRRS